MEENLREFGAEFSQVLPRPDKVDYERLKFLFQQSLLEQKPKSPENRFQFLCDANERWIYEVQPGYRRNRLLQHGFGL